MGLFSKFTGRGAERPINAEIVAAVDRALGQLGQVTHLVDPQRAVALASGGPPVWSVALVAVAGPQPYTLLVTYGLSYPVSPEPERTRIGYELSIAIPRDVPPTPWADAFLRGQAFYVITQNAELAVGTCMPFAGAPITRMALVPEVAAMQPESSLTGVLVGRDPAVPTISTPAGDLEVRRLVGVDQWEIDRAVTWDPTAFLELVRGVDPLLLTPPGRASYLPALAAAIEPRAQREGSSVENVLLDLGWQQLPHAVQVRLPQGPAAGRALAALRGRVGFGRRLIAHSRFGSPITFAQGTPGMDISPQGLELTGELATPPISSVADALAAGAPGVELALLAPSPARIRARFFDRIAWIIREYELDQQRMTRELGKLVGEAQSIAAMASQVAPSERDADRAAAAAVTRTLRFARSTDQSAIEALLEAMA